MLERVRLTIQKFLSDAQCITFMAQGLETPAIDAVQELLFRFELPHELISARSDIGPEFLSLPPSVKQRHQSIMPYYKTKLHATDGRLYHYGYAAWT